MTVRHEDQGNDGHNHGRTLHEHPLSAAHSHAPKDFGPAFAIGVALNVGLVMVQAVFGLIANSMALLADAGHNLGDVLGLLIAWGASALATRSPTPRFTYGLGGSSILAALINGVFLLVASGAIAWEAIQRFYTPEPVAGLTVMAVAGLGIVINGFTAWLFFSGSNDINIRGAFLHMAADAAVSLGVVLAGAATLLTGWQWIDPATSLVIVAVIIWSTWGLLKSAGVMALLAVPPGIDPEKVRSYLLSQSGVIDLHDLHIWPMSTTETALTCHLVMPAGHPGDAVLLGIAQALDEKFQIAHSTIQIELKSCCSMQTRARHRNIAHAVGYEYGRRYQGQFPLSQRCHANARRAFEWTHLRTNIESRPLGAIYGQRPTCRPP